MLDVRTCGYHRETTKDRLEVGRFPIVTRLRLVGAAIFALCAYPGGQAQADSRPNVVLIIADDLNEYVFDSRHPLVTPTIDRLKQESVVFERAYCAAPVCVSSRAALFSGLSPHHTGCYLNGSDPWKKAPFTEVVSLPELFRRSGYLAFGAGKLFHALPPAERWRRCWDNSPPRGGFGPFPPPEDQILGHFWGVTPWQGPDTDFPDVRNANAVIEFLGRRHDRPFFLCFGLWRPHTPFTSPARFFDLYDPAQVPVPPPGYCPDDLDDIPALGLKLTRIWGERWDVSGASRPDLWRRLLHGYYAGISFADWTIGRVLEALDNGPNANNTVLIVWSDNGYHMGEKNHYEKATLWSLSARTPLFIRLPGAKNGGAKCIEAVSSLDLYPTLVQLCELEAPPQSLDGVSLTRWLEAPSRPRETPALTFYGEGYAAVRDRRFCYIRYPDGSEELYDHLDDPYEHRNLAGDPSFEAERRRLRRFVPANFAPSMGGRLGRTTAPRPGTLFALPGTIARTSFF